MRNIDNYKDPGPGGRHREPTVKVTLEYSADRADRTTRALREKFGMPRAGLRKLHQHAIREAMAPSPKTCPHSNKIGDNYGETCQNCGAQLTGYGYNAEFKTCFHWFLPVNMVFMTGEAKNPQVCIFCEIIRATPTAPGEQ